LLKLIEISMINYSKITKTKTMLHKSNVKRKMNLLIKEKGRQKATHDSHNFI